MASLLTPSGGLFYHLRALCYRETLWAPFRAALGDWLRPHFEGTEQLILVGPSAGHCLPLDALARGRELFVLEPDPLARAILRARVSPLRWHVEARDLLVRPLLAGERGLASVLERLPRAALLFCNVLGQLHFALSDADHERFQLAFRERLLPTLEGRRWASFHDRWSMERDAGEAVPASLRFEHLPTDDELGEACFGTGHVVTALDHATSTLFPPAWPRRYFPWQITATALHLVEGLTADG